MIELTITRPDDWHLHLRDGDALKATTAASARYFGRAIVMPNLVPPVINCQQASAYRDRILAAMADYPRQFTPLMTLYLTDNTSVQDIQQAKQSNLVVAAKLYPAGATTNSDAGVSAIDNIYPALEAMQKHDLPLLIHGEVTHGDIDIFDREKVFIDKHLKRLVKDFPKLRIVLEHITTEDAVEFVEEAPANVGATITVQHLLYNRNDMLVGGIRPHYYCLPILKRDRHQLALRKAATSGNPKFFLGTDSAPHAVCSKESACGCAGCFTAYAAIEMYAEVFEQMAALDKLEGFASHFGPEFYRLKPNADSITLRKQPWTAPDKIPFGSHTVTPLRAGEKMLWRVVK